MIAGFYLTDKRSSIICRKTGCWMQRNGKTTQIATVITHTTGGGLSCSVCHDHLVPGTEVPMKEARRDSYIFGWRPAAQIIG